VGLRQDPLLQPKKIYPIDPAYIPRSQMGRKMETVAALVLLRRGEAPRYFKGRGEVDLVTSTEAVQVTYVSVIDEIDRRELKSLAEAAETTGRRPLLITRDLEDVLEIREVRVEAIPLWRWLLSQTPGRGRRKQPSRPAEAADIPTRAILDAHRNQRRRESREELGRVISPSRATPPLVAYNEEGLA
jgi:hypothetical protein